MMHTILPTKQSVRTIMDTLRQSSDPGAITSYSGQVVKLDYKPANIVIHFWCDPDDPDDEVQTQIHNHLYGFYSTVLLGSLMNVVHRVIEDVRGDHTVYRTSPLEPSDDRVSILSTVEHTYGPGDSYAMCGEEFHQTCIEGPSVTFLTRQAPSTIPVRVLLPADVELGLSGEAKPATDPALLWARVEKFYERLL